MPWAPNVARAAAPAMQDIIVGLAAAKLSAVREALTELKTAIVCPTDSNTAAAANIVRPVIVVPAAAAIRGDDPNSGQIRSALARVRTCLRRDKI